MGFDPYSVLGVPRDADGAAIKRAHRGRVKKAHPDAGGSAGEFAEVQRAWLVLSDPERRSKYDRTGDAEDVKATPDPDAPALAIISNMMHAIIADQGMDPFTVDLADALIRSLHQEIANVGKKIAAQQAPLSRAKKLKGRFKKSRGKGNDRMTGLIGWHIQQIELTIERGRQAITDCRRAQEIIAEYDFEQDPANIGLGAYYSQTAATNRWP